jgi:hypothetical protein
MQPTLFFFYLSYSLSLHASSHETAALDLETNLKAVLVYWRVAHMNFPPLDLFLSSCFVPRLMSRYHGVSFSSLFLLFGLILW